MDNFVYIHCNDIDRRNMNDSLIDVLDMAETIRKEWLTEPIQVRPVANCRFQVVEGELQFSALLQLNARFAPCRVIKEV